MEDTQREGETEREKEIFHLLLHSINSYSWQTKTRSQELHLRVAGPPTLGPSCSGFPGGLARGWNRNRAVTP